MTSARIRTQDGSARIEISDGGDVEPVLAPRPYLTTTTRSGVPVTEVSPADHLHHLGASIALPDVDGTSFWGGRTYVRELGKSTLLDNHGVQRIVSETVGEDYAEAELGWIDETGCCILTEERRITTEVHKAGWTLDWRTTLSPVAGDVTFGSPATNGRPGAFYGGIFWRAPFGTARVSSAAGLGVELAHGSTSPWLAIEGEDATLVAVTSSGMPWFVRAEGYVGFCPAIAVDGRRTLGAAETLDLDLSVLVLDASETAGRDLVELAEAAVARHAARGGAVSAAPAARDVAS